jgi:hypothetical protein
MERELIQRLATVLDGTMTLLEAEARKEAKREAGKPMRQITWQRRCEAAGSVLDDALAYLNDDAA